MRPRQSSPLSDHLRHAISPFVSCPDRLLSSQLMPCAPTLAFMASVLANRAPDTSPGMPSRSHSKSWLDGFLASELRICFLTQSPWHAPPGISPFPDPSPAMPCHVQPTSWLNHFLAFKFPCYSPRLTSVIFILRALLPPCHLVSTRSPFHTILVPANACMVDTISCVASFLPQKHSFPYPSLVKTCRV